MCSLSAALGKSNSSTPSLSTSGIAARSSANGGQQLGANPSSSTGEEAVNINAMKVPLDEASSTRFISRMDPSSELIMVGNPDRDRVGIWVNKNKTHNNDQLERKQVQIPSTLDKFLLSHLNAMHAFEFPRDEDRDRLLEIYFEHVHPILPILDKECFYNLFDKGEYSAPLVHAVLMVAARHGRAKKYLQNTDPRNFAASCARKIRALLYAGIETGSMNLCRIHAMLALHCEGPDGFTDSAYNLSCAFHYAHSIGIHLRRSDNYPHNAAVNLWWSLWALDRMSTCINGGPVNSYQRDVGLRIEECPPSEPHALRFAEVCRTLDEAIELYRPAGDQRIPESVSLPQSVPDDGTAFTAIIRLLHLTAIILTYKRNASNGDNEDDGDGGIEDGGTSTSSNTTSSSDGSITPLGEMLVTKCLEVYDIVESYTDLPPLPIIPYAVSLTFTVYVKYFSMETAQSAWKRGTELLQSLAGYWWAAEAVSSMSQSIFEKLEAEHCENLRAQMQMQQQQQELPKADNFRVELDHVEPDQAQKVPLIHDPIPSLENLLNGNESSFAGQTLLFGELDRDVVDYWFPGGAYAGDYEF